LQGRSFADDKKFGLATHRSVAPDCYRLLLAMRSLVLLVLAKPGLKKSMLCPVHDGLPK
jgi:hypothetical protein